MLNGGTGRLTQMVTVYKYDPDPTNESSLFQHSVFPFYIFLTSIAVNTVWALSTLKKRTQEMEKVVTGRFLQSFLLQVSTTQRTIL